MDYLKKVAEKQILSSPLIKKHIPRLVETVKTRRVAREFKIGRLSAAASMCIGKDASAFLEELGVTDRISAKLRRRIEQGLHEFERVWQDWDASVRQCEEVFWNYTRQEWRPDDARLAIHRERRIKSEARMRPLQQLGFLLDKPFVPSVRFSIPSPDDIPAALENSLQHPEELFAAPDTMPPIETSYKVPGPSGQEYVIRFPSPSRFMGDMVFARIFEPRKPLDGQPTLIYSGAFGMAYDQLTYWPEETNLGRPLAALGYRVVIIESPWHGRRISEGFSSGEPFLSTAPLGCVQFVSAQVQETAVLMHWARTSGSSAVAVAGISLGGMAMQQLVCRCRGWPARLRPDAALLSAATSHAEHIVRDSELSHMIGLTDALQNAGWNDQTIMMLNNIFDTPAPAIDPRRVNMVFGAYDSLVPYATATAIADAWRLPQENIITWSTGHLGVLMDMLKTPQGYDLFLGVLQKARG